LLYALLGKWHHMLSQDKPVFGARRPHEIAKLLNQVDPPSNCTSAVASHAQPIKVNLDRLCEPRMPYALNHFSINKIFFKH